ncbi:MAG: hypothetical protein Fur006_28680 [Coleofasciculaceae cyanobacterium]
MVLHQMRSQEVNLKITAAVVREKAQPLTIEELELDTPRADEVLVLIVATGLNGILGIGVFGKHGEPTEAK